tara:strand:+ start:2698 stop:4938 length:2241 start_codon:yes stop_codon:yes gene_type:complete
MSSNQMQWDDGQSHNQVSAIAMLHRLLRGKYLLTIVLVLIFGGVGAFAGYKSRQPQYESVGVIRIQPSLPKVLYESEQSTVTSMFSSFVNTQAELISRGGVIQRALESDEWRGVSHLSNIQSAFDVRKDLKVRSSRSAQEIITVAYSDENAQVSAVLVKAIMESYLTEFGKQGSIKNPAIVSALNKRKSDLDSARSGFDNKIAEIVLSYDTENFGPLIEAATFKVQQLELQSQKLQRQQDIYQRFQTAREQKSDGPMTQEEAAKIDPMISDLINQRRMLVNSRAEMLSEGVGPQHRDVIRIQSMIDSKQTQIDARIEELESGGSASVLVDDDGDPIPSKEILEFRIERLQREMELAKEESDDLYRAAMDMETLREDRADIQASIAEVSRRLDQINTESLVEDIGSISGKISIVANPVRASQPTSDPRIKMAAAGFVGVGAIPAVAILAFGFFSHRVQYSDDGILAGADSGIIGMLPDLGSSLSDNELAAASAFAVHQIRSQLQIKNEEGDSRVYGVTSPAPQDGKTSLIIALGLSFAESGDKTLLVDLDFIGRGLSLHFGYPDSMSLADALDSPDQLDELVCATEFPGLSILPAGYGDDDRVSKLSPRSITGLLAHIREEYDTVLIDTGPILGSVEAAFVTPQADGVILVVGRGQHKALVKKAIDQLVSMGGNIAATIFNRALIQELRQSSSSMSVHFSRQMSRQQDAMSKNVPQWGGPVAGALFKSKENKQQATADTAREKSVKP